MLRPTDRCRALLLVCLLLGFQGCAQDPEQPGASGCERFERALAEGNEDECLRVKDRCLAEVDQTIKEHGEQMHALLTALGADTEREKVLRPAIAKLEKDLSELRLKRERLNAAQCDKK
ncbi:MAG TPA: hypothetical protein VF131_26940 [Blastocatellia bacterium]|nr:hypothetical protein [Blastocatellia bacterium]